jgi:hypothetical protein
MSGAGCRPVAVRASVPELADGLLERCRHFGQLTGGGAGLIDAGAGVRGSGSDGADVVFDLASACGRLRNIADR